VSLDGAALPGFHIATGFSGHGFGIGPGAGRLMADIVAGDRPIVDPAPFAFERFRLPGLPDHDDPTDNGLTDSDPTDNDPTGNEEMMQCP